MFKFNIQLGIQKDSTKAVIQVEWAENYACFCKNKIQVANFGQNQISIFTYAIWHRQIKSLAIVSDSNNHTELSIVANINKIIKLLSEDVTEIHGFSDNAAFQLKNKYVLTSMKILEDKPTIKMQWHFFATIHGIGAVDGIGATVNHVARKSFIRKIYNFYL